MYCHTWSTCSRSTQSRPQSFFHLYCLCCKCECVLLLQAPVPAIHIHVHRTLSLHKAYKISTLCVMLQQAPVPVSGTHADLQSFFTCSNMQVRQFPKNTWNVNQMTNTHRDVHQVSATGNCLQYLLVTGGFLYFSCHR